MGNYNLEDSPIYAMSLGNHELFHSNFWAWMMEKYPTIIKEVFNIDIDVNNVEIKREFQNTDISIIVDKKVYVIENKFKSIPDEKQLVTYKEKFNKKKIKYNGKKLEFESGLLISPADLDFYCPDGCQHKKYSDILKNLKNFFENKHDNFEKKVIDDYIKSTECAISIINEEYHSGDILRLSFDCYKEYEKNKLSDILRKLNAQKFAKYFKGKIKNNTELISIEKYLYVDTDYTNKNAIVNAFIIIPNSDFENDELCEINKKAEYKLLIGVQIQGNKYCRAVSRSKKWTKKSTPEALFKEFEENWFDNKFDKTKKTIIFPSGEEKTTTMSPRCKKDKTYGEKYNIFDKDNKNSFIYQYYSLAKEPSFESIKELLLSDLIVAKKIIGNPKEYSIKE